MRKIWKINVINLELTIEQAKMLKVCLSESLKVEDALKIECYKT